MTVYVHALTDTPVMPWEEDDGRRIESFEIGGFFVVGERRTTLPPASEAELQRQHSLVLRVAAAVSAVVPARFGSLLEESELAAILRQRKDLIKTSLDHVRGTVQMTLRMPAAAAASIESAPASGRDYLQRRRDELIPPLNADGENTLRDLRAFVLDERRKPGDGGTVTIYHLIARGHIREYRETVMSKGRPGIALSGPFAAFAFAPDLFT